MGGILEWAHGVESRGAAYVAFGLAVLAILLAFPGYLSSRDPAVLLPFAIAALLLAAVGALLWWWGRRRERERAEPAA